MPPRVHGGPAPVPTSDSAQLLSDPAALAARMAEVNARYSAAAPKAMSRFAEAVASWVAGQQRALEDDQCCGEDSEGSGDRVGSEDARRSAKEREAICSALGHVAEALKANFVPYPTYRRHPDACLARAVDHLAKGPDDRCATASGTPDVHLLHVLKPAGPRAYTAKSQTWAACAARDALARLPSARVHTLWGVMATKARLTFPATNHGTQLPGPPPPGATVLLVDDACHSGDQLRTILWALVTVYQAGHVVAAVPYARADPLRWLPEDVGRRVTLLTSVIMPPAQELVPAAAARTLGALLDDGSTLTVFQHKKPDDVSLPEDLGLAHGLHMPPDVCGAWYAVRIELDAEQAGATAAPARKRRRVR